jgi:hypothetical protein
MMLPEDWVDAPEWQSFPSTGSFTGKELDPDFVAANSVNRRYHFPARFYLPGRAMFGQVDQLLRTSLIDHLKSLGQNISIRVARALLNQRRLHLLNPFLGAPYSYVGASPARFSDPMGLQAAVPKPIDDSEDISAIQYFLSECKDDCLEVREVSGHTACLVAKAVSDEIWRHVEDTVPLAGAILGDGPPVGHDVFENLWKDTEVFRLLDTASKSEDLECAARATAALQCAYHRWESQLDPDLLLFDF